MVQLCSRCGAGGTGDPPVTCSMVEGGPCAACSESAAIYLQIRQLEEEIAELKAKRRALATTMNANHDPFIHKLPPEIGSHIFCLSSIVELSNIELVAGSRMGADEAVESGSSMSKMAPVSVGNP